MNTKFCLHVPPNMWREFKKSMLESRMFNEEVIGFFFCQRHQVSKRKVRYIPKTWVVPTAECYEHQSTDGLILTQRFHSYLLENHLFAGLDLVHIHTHAGRSIPDFSYIDDRYESEYSRFIGSNFPKKPRLISGVFDEDLQSCKFRMWDRKGREFERVEFCNSLFEISNSQNLINNPDLMFARQKIFGEVNQNTLSKLKVGLIGCGGIGSIFAELLGRLGVKNWVLIDPDKLEQVNLNRMPGATQEMVEQNWHKVHYVKHLIKKVYAQGSHVKTIPTTIESDLAKQEIASCDLIVVATDNHLSRKTAQELALQYMRPLVCLGTHIDVKPDNTPRMYSRITVPPIGGGWCLMCGNIINLQRAALESAPSAINNMAAGAGYLEGINDPSVFWLNSICASTAVGVIHGMVSGFLNVDSGIDWIYEFPGSEWRKTDTEYLQTDDCYFCGINSSENVVQNSDFESPEFENRGFDNSDFIIW
ncbi:HesA/MoeB/ThiF family protein [Calothrix sp. CCY 0018]|uniref:HesA/MoeB/ThiF family protein n=1 Tax=Calothrix sp. CCY 0018 TaxID=3103864 RepID=UPI0039C65289